MCTTNLESKQEKDLKKISTKQKLLLDQKGNGVEGPAGLKASAEVFHILISSHISFVLFSFLSLVNINNMLQA